MRTPVCEKFGIEFPIFAFSHCRDVVAAVSRAGGLGVLGALAFTPEELEIELKWIDENIDGKPYGVDLVMPANYIGKGGKQPDEAELRAMIPQEYWDFLESIMTEYDVPPLPDDMLEDRAKAAGLGVDDQAGRSVDIALAHPGVRLLVNALGPPPKEVVDKAHEHGVLVGALIGNMHHAQKQIDIGVDILVAQGGEAGGHTGDVATMVLVPEIVDAVGDTVPVLAAGGIGCGRQMTAALALGAQGVWTGSIWLTVAEADTQPEPLANLLAADSRGTVRSKTMTGKSARQLRTAWTDAWEREGAPKTLPMPLQGILWNAMARRVARSRTKELSGFPVGQIVGRMNKVRPTQEVILEMVEEWIATTERLSGLLDDSAAG
ncbi:MAG TPA: nitronate monooxygenase family protein [Mycobacteriales bacterium]|nr:nitronate monooxygenase family protein [Mycobacteriales bacterium]